MFKKRCYLIFKDENRIIREQPPTAPSTFKLVPVRTEQEHPPPPLANPTGPGHLKPSLDQTDRQALQSVDDHAIQVHKDLVLNEVWCCTTNKTGICALESLNVVGQIFVDCLNFTSS